MPIRPENRGRYPDYWSTLSKVIRFARAGRHCEWPGCDAVDGHPHPVTGSRVVLTVAHLDHTPENCRLDNLLALCQRCHNRYDAAHRRGTRRQRGAVGDLFPSNNPRP